MYMRILKLMAKTKMEEAYETLTVKVIGNIDTIYNKVAGSTVHKVKSMNAIDKHLQQIREALQWERNSTMHTGED